MPYHLQQNYFFLSEICLINCISISSYFYSLHVLVGPPLLLPVYFHMEVLYYSLRKKKWKVSYNQHEAVNVAIVHCTNQKFNTYLFLRTFSGCSYSISDSTLYSLGYWEDSGVAFVGISSSDSWRVTGLCG